MRRLLTFLLITIVVCAIPALAQKRNITEKDLFGFVWVSDPQISPDGSRVAFVKITVNEKKDGYNTSIWTVSPTTGETHQLTNGIRDSSPRWSPDGKYLVFVRVTEKDGKPDLPQLFMLTMAGGDSFQFTSLPRGAGQPLWSPDGKTIAFVSHASPEDLAKQKEQSAPRAQPSPSPAGGDAKKPEDQHESDVRVITRTSLSCWSSGFFASPPAGLGDG